MLDQEVDELAYLGSMLAMARHDRPYPGVAALKARQHFNQLAAGEIGHDVVIGQLCESEPLKGGIEQRRPRIGLPGAAHVYLAMQAVDIEAPQVAGADQAAMMYQFRYRMRLRHALEIAG